MRQGLQAEGHLRPAHTDASRRPAFLLPDAELPAALRHRAGGEEAHRQPHEPARGQGAAGRRQQDPAAAAARRRRGEARAVLPAVLRAALPAVRRGRGVQARRGPGAGGLPAGAVTRAAAALAPGALARAPRPVRRRAPLQLSAGGPTYTTRADRWRGGAAARASLPVHSVVDVSLTGSL